MKINLILYLLTCLFGQHFLSIEGFGQSVVRSSAVCESRIRSLRSDLDDNNPLMAAIQRNQRGDGIQYGWMTKMETRGVKHIVATVTIEYRPQFLNLSLKRFSLYNSHYPYDAKNKILLSETDVEEIRQELELPVYEAAASFVKQSELPRNLCGTIDLNLLTDSCLPIVDTIPTFNECK